MEIMPPEPPLTIPGFIRLGPTTRTSGTAIDGPVFFGIDLVGTVRDTAGLMEFEEHPVGAPRSVFGLVPPLAKLILLVTLPEYLATHNDAGWASIRADLLKAPAGSPRPLEAAGEAVLPGISGPPELFADLFENGGGAGVIREKWPVQPPRSSGALPPFQPAVYVFTLESMRITETRSRHEDSDKASVSVAVGANPPQTVTRDLGNHNNGTFALGMSVGPFQVADPNIGIAANYLIVNAGNQSWSTVDNLLTKAGSALASAGAKTATDAAGSAIGASIGTGILPIVGSVVGAIAGWLVGEALGLFFADCDGPVAAEQPAFKGVDLWNRTHTPSNSFTHETYHPGIDSPSGCGSNSEYYTTWSITRVG